MSFQLYQSGIYYEPQCSEIGKVSAQMHNASICPAKAFDPKDSYDTSRIFIFDSCPYKSVRHNEQRGLKLSKLIMRWSLLAMERIMEMTIGLSKILGAYLGAKLATFEWHEIKKIIAESLLLLPIPLSRFFRHNQLNHIYSRTAP